MPGRLRAGLCCPECGLPVLLVFHEWHGAQETVLFEYHHEEDARRPVPAPCKHLLPYADGVKRYQAESA